MAATAHGVAEPEVGHHGDDDGVVGEPSLLVQVEGADGDDVVAVHDAAVGVDRREPVGVAVEGQAHVGAVAHDGLACRASGWFDPQSALMFTPSGSACSTVTCAPSRREHLRRDLGRLADPLAQST